MYNDRVMFNGMGLTTEVKISSYAVLSKGEKAWACRIGYNPSTYEIKREFIESKTEKQAKYHGQAEGYRYYTDYGNVEEVHIRYDFMEREGMIIEWTNAGQRHLAIVDKASWNGTFELDMLFPGVWDDIKAYLKGTISAKELKEIRDDHKAYMRRIGFNPD